MADDMPAREAMEFDVVIVGAGPAGLAAAIRLKQLDPGARRGRGREGLRGRRAYPVRRGDRSDRARPAAARMAQRRHADQDAGHATTASTGSGHPAALRLPNFLMPPLMSNHGNFIVSLGNVCRWLATKAEALGVEIYPGFAAAEVLYDDNGAVAGVATGDMGVGKDGEPQGRLHPRHGAARQIHAVRRGRARHPVQAADRAASGSTKDREPQKFGIGLKELWQVAPDKHQPGLVQHTFGWPLDNSHRRRLVPLSLRRQSGVGRLRGASQLRQSRICRRSRNSSASRRIR